MPVLPPLGVVRNLRTRPRYCFGGGGVSRRMASRGRVSRGCTESLGELVRFAPDAYGVRWVNHVALFIVTEAGVILVDPNGQVNPRTPSLIKEAIRAVTAQ